MKDWTTKEQEEFYKSINSSPARLEADVSLLIMYNNSLQKRKDPNIEPKK